jgi:hypothetical protein
MTTPQLDPPIFAQLVEERGDVPAQVRDAAERVRRRLEQDTHFTATAATPVAPAPAGDPSPAPAASGAEASTADGGVGGGWFG